MIFVNALRLFRRCLFVGRFSFTFYHNGVIASSLIKSHKLFLICVQLTPSKTMISHADNSSREYAVKENMPFLQWSCHVSYWFHCPSFPGLQISLVLKCWLYYDNRPYRCQTHHQKPYNRYQFIIFWWWFIIANIYPRITPWSFDITFF